MKREREAIAGADIRFELATFGSAGELQPLWLDLEQRAAAHVFLSWDWIGCWIKETEQHPLTIIGRAGARIVLLGVLVPRVRRDVPPLAIPGLHLHMSGIDAQDVIALEYNGFLVDHEWAGSIEPRAIAFLLGERTGYDELHLKAIPAGFTQCVAASGFRLREVQRKPAWFVDLDTLRAAGTDYLDALSRNTRQQIRRSVRLYERRGPLLARRAENADEALVFLDAMKELHQRYWTGRGEPGGFAFPFFERFQKRLIRTCVPHGTVEMVKVTAGEQVIGYVYNLVYRGHVYAYQTGIDYEDDARLKPGLVSHVLCIESHLREGDHVYDFMAGEYRYKANLGRPGPEMVYLVAQRQTWPLRIENALRGVRRRLYSTGSSPRSASIRSK